MKIYLKQNKTLFLLSIICNISSSLGFVYIAILLQKIIDVVIDLNINKFFELVIFSSIYSLSLGLLLYLSSLLSKKIICLITGRLRIDIFKGVMNQNYRDYHLKNTADYLSIINNDIKLIEDNYLVPMFEIIQYSVVFEASIGVMFYLNAGIAIWVILSIVLMFVIPNFFGKRLEKRQSQFSSSLCKFTNDTKDILSGFEVIRSYCIKNHIFSRYAKSNSV